MSFQRFLGSLNSFLFIKPLQAALDSFGGLQATLGGYHFQKPHEDGRSRNILHLPPPIKCTNLSVPFKRYFLTFVRLEFCKEFHDCHKNKKKHTISQFRPIHLHYFSMSSIKRYPPLPQTSSQFYLARSESRYYNKRKIFRRWLYSAIPYSTVQYHSTYHGIKNQLEAAFL